MSAMQKQGMQPKTVSEKYGRGFTEYGEDPTLGTQADLTNENAYRPEVIKNKLSGDGVLDIDDQKPAVGDGSLEAARNAEKAKAEAEAKAKAEAEARRKAEAEQAAQQAAADAYMKQLANQKAKADRAAAERREQEKKDRESRIQAGQSMQGRPRMAISRPDLEDRPAREQGGAGVTTNLRSRSKGGLLNKKPKKKKVMKRGGLASKK